MSLLGHIVYNAAVILWTEALVTHARKSGNLMLERNAQFTKRVLGRAGPSYMKDGAAQATTVEGNKTMSVYDIVGDLFDDDDVGSIGMDVEELLVSGMGNSDIIGDEDVSSSKAALVKRLMSKDAAAVVKRKLQNRRRYPLGFVPTDILGGATAPIPSNPQNLYRAERLVIPSDICFDIGVADIKVGNQSQFVQNAEVPAAVFSEVAIDTALHFDTAEVGNQMTISARNKIGIPVQFTAALIGTAAK
jgi:hypothetical protein